MKKFIKKANVLLMAAMFSMSIVPFGIHATESNIEGAFVSSDIESISEGSFSFSRDGIEADSIVRGNQIEIDLSNPIRHQSMSVIEIANERLLENGFSQDLINTLPESSLEIVAMADTAILSLSYYAEIITGEQVSEMVPISISELQRGGGLGITRPNISDFEIYVASEDLNTAPFALEPFLTQNVGGGRIQVATAIFGVSGILSQYMVISEFIWLTMPTYCGTDFFGITRDNNTVVITKSLE